MKHLLRHPAAQLAAIAGVCLVAYGRALSRYFVSEDFPILRVLSQGSWLDNAREQFTGSWLGLTFTPFYRPLSTLLLDLEYRAFGVAPAGYLAAHFALHVANTTLLYWIVRRLRQRGGGDGGNDGGDLVPFLAAWAFALYPLHPNTVLFVGSFATLFSATFSFASFLLLLRSGQNGRRAELVAAWALFAAAVFSYEGAAVMPGIFIAAEVLFGPRRPDWRALAARHLPFLAVLGTYLGIRRWALGFAVGGEPGEFLARAGIDWPRFLYPAYELPLPPWVRTLFTLAVVAVTLVGLRRWLRPRGVRAAEGLVHVRWWLLAVAWIVVAQLPFTVIRVVPSNGRFWYVSAAGLGLLIAAVIGALVPRGWRRPAIAAFALTLGLGYFPRLLAHVDAHVAASLEARKIQTRLQEFALANAPDERYFLAGHPRFFQGWLGADVAQIFHWGLGDAMGPPFLERDLRFYPLPPLPRDRLMPLFRRPDLGRVLRLLGGWVGPQATTGNAEVAAIRVLRPPDGTYPADHQVRFEAPPAERYGIVVLTRGNAVLRDADAREVRQGVRRGRLPARFIESMRRLYDDEVFWWIEARDRDDRLVATSPLRTIRSELGVGPPSRN